jgi:hypothetical protein
MSHTAFARARRTAHAVARRRTDRGAVAVEFALVLPVLVMLLLGTVTTGLVYSDHLSIANAAREGGRFGSAVNFCGASTCTVADTTQWADSVQARVRQAYYNSGSTLSASQVCVLLVNSSGTLATPTLQGSACSANVPANPTTIPSGSCLVKVWVKKPARIDLAVVSIPSFNIAATSVSFYGRVTGACTAN